MLDTKASKSPAIHYVHRPTYGILIWIIISVPLVAWDTLFVQLRPYTMPGGRLHYPLWHPYKIYSRVDLVYGWPAIENHNGFTGSQSAMNIPESVFYLWYLYVVCQQVKDWSYKGVSETEVRGKGVNLAVLLCLSGAVMTLAKTVLYCKSSLQPVEGPLLITSQGYVRLTRASRASATIPSSTSSSTGSSRTALGSWCPPI
jgi:hypothetical protein